MTRPAARLRGFMLVEIIGVLVLGLALAGILGKLVIDAVYLQRIAAEHANRVAVMDSLTRSLRQDALATVAYEMKASRLTLKTVTADGPADVVYALEPGLLRRILSGTEDRVWRSLRLRFAWRREQGPRGDVLLLDLIETPPARASAHPRRTYTAAFGLPATGAQPAVGGEEL